MNELIEMAPKEMQKMIKTCLTMDYTAKPHYEQLILILRKLMAKDVIIGSNLHPIPH